MLSSDCIEDDCGKLYFPRDLPLLALRFAVLRFLAGKWFDAGDLDASIEARERSDSVTALGLGRICWL